MAAAPVHWAPRCQVARASEPGQGATTVCETFLSQEPVNGPPRKDARLGRQGSAQTGQRPSGNCDGDRGVVGGLRHWAAQIVLLTPLFTSNVV